MVHSLAEFPENVKSIQYGPELKNFGVKKEMTKGLWKRLLDGVILEPNISGVGFNLKKFFRKS